MSLVSLRRLLRDNVRLFLVAIPIPALLACNDSPSSPDDRRGAISITVQTTGVDFPATFRAQLNTNFIREVRSNQSTFLSFLSVGTYTVALNLPSNCTTTENPRTVNVEKGNTALVTFDVTCVATSGILRVSTTTSGEDADPTGYRLVLTSGLSFVTGANSTQQFGPIPGGSHIVEITEIASNCSLMSSATSAITVAVGGLKRDTASVSFSVTCVKTQKFAFRRNNPSGFSVPQSVDVAYADGSEVVAIAAGFTPAWSPDGNSLAFLWLSCDYYYYYGCAKSGLAAMNTKTGSFLALTQDTIDSDPAWRPPDGGVIAFSRRGAIYFVEPAPQKNPALLNVPATVRKASQPSWSPDGVKLAIACEMDDGKSEICAINADGTSFVRLTNDSSTDVNPEFSPDGTQIAFSTTDVSGSSQIALMSSAGGAITKLTAGKNPAWVRDGTKILFEGIGNARGIFMIALASGTVTRLTNGDDYDPAWRP